MKSDKKDIALIIAGMGKPKGKARDDHDEEGFDEAGEDDGGKSSAAEELIRAVKRGDVDGVVEALDSFYELCRSSASNDNDEDY